jgi:hypothetical protein
VYLEPLAKLVERGRCPADELRAGRHTGDAIDAVALRSARVATGRR